MKSNYLVIALVALSTVISFFIRFKYLDYTYGDYIAFLSNWVETIKANGFLSALAEPFYNYTPLYMYILTFLAKLDVNVLYGIKIVSFVFEYVAAFYVGRIAFLIVKREWIKWLPFAIVPLLPSITLNSAFMSQCDAIYVSFLLGSVYYLLRRKQITAMIFLGIAFALKAQAAFILPFYFVYLLRGNIRWYLFIIVPLVYFISVIPAWMVGRPLIELLTVYMSQTGDSYVLASYIPNIYLWIYPFLDSNKLPGMIFMTLLVIIGGLILMNKKYVFTLDAWVALLFLSAIICPYFLPSMHERYLYLGDLVGILYICINSKKIMNWLSALGIWFVSFFSCTQSINAVGFYYDRSGFDHWFFQSMGIFPWQGMAVLYLGIICYLIFDLFRILERRKKDEEFVALSV